MDNAVKFYKDVLHFDNMHVEAVACIATHHFYTDQPEVALKFYRSVHWRFCVFIPCLPVCPSVCLLSERESDGCLHMTCFFSLCRGCIFVFFVAYLIWIFFW